MTTRTTSCLVAIAVSAAGCSNLGPFRASGGDDDADAAVGGDGRQADAPTGDDGQQVAQPRELASSTHYPVSLAAAGGMAYFTEAGIAPYGVSRIPATGGSVGHIDLGSTVPSLIEATTTAVVWTANNEVVRANSAFTGFDTLATATNLSGAIALSSTDVYYARSISGNTNDRLERVSLDGGTPEPLYTTLETSPQLATTTTDLYWTGYTTAYDVRTSSLATPDSFTTVATAPADLLTATGAAVCWMQQPDPNQYKYDVWCNRQGTTKRIARDYSQVFDIVVTASDVFIAVRGFNNVGEIWRYHLSTQVLDTYITLGTGDLPTQVATDGTDLFWIAYHAVPEGSGAIYALAL